MRKRILASLLIVIMLFTNYAFIPAYAVGDEQGEDEFYDFTTLVNEDVYLEAKWEPISYNIYYVLNGGTNDSRNPSTYTIEDTINFWQPTKANSTFIGWYEDEVFTMPIDSISNRTGDITVYAKWEEHVNSTYKVEHYKENLNGTYSLADTDSLTAIAGDAVEATPKTYTGFKEHLTHEQRVNSGIVKSDGSLVLKLYYERIKYRVTFEPHNGSVIEDQIVKYQNKATKPQEITKSGYEFVEWRKIGETQAYDFNTPITSNIDLEAIWTPESYRINYVLNGGTNDSSNPSTYTREDEITFRDPTRTGYEFQGWFEDASFRTSIEKIKNRTGDITIYAKWSPKTVAYTVQHYKKNSSGNYELAETENLTGVVDTTVNATAKTYEGFKENTTYEQRVISGTVKADGSLVLKLYYDPISYNINYVLNGGTNSIRNPNSYTINDIIHFENPTRLAYNFLGWYEDAAFTMPITGIENRTGDITVYAKWKERGDIAYKVEHYRENASGNYELYETDNTLKDTVNATVTAVPRSYIGYRENTTYEGRIATGTVKADGSLVLKLYYDKVKYVVTFEPHNGTTIENQLVKYKDKAHEPTNPSKSGYTFGGWREIGRTNLFSFDTEIISNTDLEAVWTPQSYRINYVLNGGTNDSSNPSTYTKEDTVTFRDASRAGYNFLGWYEEASFTTAIPSFSNRTGDITVYAKWSPKTDIAFKVEHYKKNSNGGYDLADTENKTGTVDTTVTATAKTYEGFKENTTHSERIPSGLVKANGSLVLKLYYDPISYNINYVLNGGTNDSSNPSTYNVNDVITFRDARRAGYDFLGWYEDAAFTTPITGVENRTGDITVYAKWQAKDNTPYKVEHYKETSNGNYELTVVDSKTGKTDTTVTATAKNYTGYVENTTHPGRVPSGVVAPDGSLVLKLYYDKEKYIVTFEPHNGSIIENQIVKYQETATVPTQPTKNGYEFGGWRKIGQTESYDFGTPVTSNVDLEAVWTPERYRILYVLDGGTNNPNNPSTYTIEDTINFKPATKTGYDFAGWYEDSTFTALIPSISNRSGDITIYAKWTPQTGIPYKVEHYKKNSNGDYQLEDTENFTGRTDSLVAATVKTYNGYRENTSHADRKNAGIVKADGSLVLKLYYDPIIYNITYVLNGGANDSRNPSIYTVNDTINFAAATREAYNFLGWYEDAEFTMPITRISNRTGDITLYAKWKIQGDIPYKVEHYKEDSSGNYVLDSVDTLKDDANTTVTAVPNVYEGYQENTTYSGRVATGIVKVDGSLVLKLYYDRAKYTVTFDAKNGTNVPDQIVKYKEKAEQPTNPSKRGYTFGGWQEVGKTGTYNFNTEITSDKHLEAIWNPVSYRINYVLNGGTNDSSNPSTYTIEDTVTFRNASRTGYDFAGWYEDAAYTIGIATFSNRSGDITVYAKWIPQIIEYKVEHYKQNNSGRYVLEDTDNLTGTMDTVVTAVAKDYEGYKENVTHASRVASGTIKADGSLVLKLYYDQISYRIEYVLNGGTNDSRNPSSYKVTDTINFRPATRQGYDFIGWYEDSGYTSPIDSISNRTGDIILYAKWQPKGDTAYKVEHYKENASGGYDLVVTDSLSGETGKTVTAIPKNYIGYVENTIHEARVAEGAIKADGSLVLRLYYDKVKYRVTFEPHNGSTIESQIVKYQDKAQQPSNPSKSGYTFGGWRVIGENSIYNFETPVISNVDLEAVWNPINYRINYVLNGGTNNSANPTRYTRDDTITFRDATRLGYNFLGWYEDAAFTTGISTISNRSGDITVYAKWAARTDTAYKVEHYKKNGAGNYVLADTENLTGTTDTAVSAIAKTYTGYKENTGYEGRIESGLVKADGSLVLKLYYDPISYNINYVLNGGTNDSRNPNSYTVNDAITLAAPTRTAYNFQGWFEDAEFTTPITTIENRIGDITVYAKWKIQGNIPYKVEHYKEATTGNYVLEETETLRADALSEVTAIAKIYEGYRENTKYSERVAEGTVALDGSLVLKLYYDKIKYTVTFDAKNGTDVPDQIIKYKDKAEEPTNPSKRGYDFGGWKEIDKTGIYNFNTEITENKNLEAIWNPISYRINYELNGGTNDSLNPSTYTIEDTVTFKPASKQGYNFEGWYEDTTFTMGIESFSNRSGDVTVYAKWSPRTDTPYKVEHYKENKNGVYELADTDNLTGTTDSLVIATAKEYASYKENMAHEDRRNAGLVAPDGSLVLKLYYERVKYKVTFEPHNGGVIEDQIVKYLDKAVEPQQPTKVGYEFDSWRIVGETTPYNFDTEITSNLDLEAVWKPTIYNISYELYGGTNDSQNPATYTIEDRISFKPATKLGYDFMGWYEDTSYRTVIDSIENRTGDITIYAKWVARTDTAYKVEHYKEDMEGNYILAETDELQGTTDTIATAVSKEYSGFYEDTSYEGRIPSGNIEPDGSLVLKLYYTREKYTITFNPKNGTEIPDQTVKYEHKAQEPENPTKNGYTFDGWKEKGKDELYNFDTPVTSNVDLEAVWTPIIYNINYVLNGGTNDSRNPATYTIEDNIDLQPATKQGYFCMGWYEDQDFTTKIDSIYGRTGDITVYAKWAPRIDTEYKVEHYKEGANGKYELAVTDTLPGTTDSMVSASPKLYTGYYENKEHEQRVAEGVVAADGSLVLKLFYDKEKYTVTFDPKNGTEIEEQIVKYQDKAEEPDGLTKEGYELVGWREKYRPGLYDFEEPVTRNIDLEAIWKPVIYNIEYVLDGGTNDIANPTSYTIEDIVTLKPAVRLGYDFLGWYEETENGDERTNIIANRTGDITLCAKWEARKDTPYKVEHYKEAKDGTYKLEENEYLKGETDSIITAEAKKYEGFKENVEHKDRVNTGKLKADGSLVLKLFYERLEYKVTFDSDQGTKVPNQTVKYEDKVAKPEDPTRPDYEFKGWYYEDDNGNEVKYNFNKPVTSDVHLIAKWQLVKDNLAPGIIPQTGVYTTFELCLMVILSIFAFISGKKYFALRKKEKEQK